MIDQLGYDLLVSRILPQLDSASLACCMLTNRELCQAARDVWRPKAFSSLGNTHDSDNVDGIRFITRISDVLRAGPTVIGWARSIWDDFPWNASLFGMAVACTKAFSGDVTTASAAIDSTTLDFLREEGCPLIVGALFNESLERGQIAAAEWIYSVSINDESLRSKLRYLASKGAANASVAWVGGSPLVAIRTLASFCLDYLDSTAFLRATAETGNRSMMQSIYLWIDGVPDALAVPLKPWPPDAESILLAACKAATNGHVHVLEWLEESPFHFGLAHPSVTKNAAEGCQWDVISFLQERELLQGYAFPYLIRSLGVILREAKQVDCVACAAAAGGHLDLLLWAIEQFSCDIDGVCHAAASGCHVHILEHFSKEGHANATDSSVFFSLLRGCAIQPSKLNEDRVLRAISWLSANGCDKSLFRCECRPVLETGIALKSVAIVHTILGLCYSVDDHFPLENIRLGGIYYVKAAGQDFEALFHKVPITEQEWEISHIAVVSAVAGRGNLRLLKHLLRVYRIGCDAAKKAMEAAENKKQLHVLRWLRNNFAKE